MDTAQGKEDISNTKHQPHDLLLTFIAASSFFLPLHVLHGSNVEREGVSISNTGLFELSIPRNTDDSESKEQEARRLVACFYQEVRRLHSLAFPQGFGLGIGDTIYPLEYR